MIAKRDNSFSLKFMIGGLFCLFFILLAGDAFAQVNMVIENVDDKTQSIPQVVVIAGWLLGTGFTIAGLLGLKNYAASPDQVPIQQPLVRLLIGGMAIALPYVLETSQNTIIEDADSTADAPAIRLYDGAARPSQSARPTGNSGGGGFGSIGGGGNSGPAINPYGGTGPGG